MRNDPRADPNRSISYDEQRLVWRKSQTENNIRALAADYIRGMVDECTTDAFLEYEERWGSHAKRNVDRGKGSGSRKKSTISLFN